MDSFVLFVVVTIGLDVAAARAKPEKASWHGSTLATTATALRGLLSLVFLYNAPSFEPSVLPDSCATESVVESVCVKESLAIDKHWGKS